jgi:sortase A
MHRERVSAWLRRLEIACVVLGIACVAWYAFVRTDASLVQSQQRMALERILARRALPGEGQWFVSAPSGRPGTGLIGQLEIPRIGLSATVMTGDDEAILRVAVGYLADTPPPWGTGNSAVAGHRDSFFRPLQGIRAGDDVRVVTSYGTFRYQVRRTLVVDPEDVWVLDSLPQVNLTLITCFPFSFVGHAPRRFVVQAEKLQAATGAGSRLRWGE